MNCRILFMIGVVICISETNGYGLDKYAGYKILRVYPKSDDQFEMLKRLEDTYHNQVQVWRISSREKRFLEFLSEPGMLDTLMHYLRILGIEYVALTPDVLTMLAEHIRENENIRNRNGQGGLQLDQYNTWGEIRDWINDLPGRYPDMVTVSTLGESWEGRPLLLVKIKPGNDTTINKPAIWLDAAIHSNEWIAPATLLYFINSLLTRSQQDANFLELVERFDWYLLPVFNVDGYVHTWNKDRLWRKSRSARSHDNGTVTCVGVDLNRNWDAHWGRKEGSSNNPCTHNYGGPEAESEPEVEAVVRFLRAHHQQIKAYIALHSYGQYWMLPYGYSRQEQPDNLHELVNVSRLVTDAIKSVNGTEYTYDNIANLVGQVSGSSVDFTYEQLGIKYSFGVELRDQGGYGPLLPIEQIVPNAEEAFAGILELATILAGEHAPD